jgi:hypothetical protein
MIDLEMIAIARIPVLSLVQTATEIEMIEIAMIGTIGTEIATIAIVIGPM